MVNKEKILNISKKILAFSLAEVLISMVILSVFIAGSMKVVTMKPKPRKITYPHGYFEVYNSGGLKKHYVYENSTRDNNTACGSSCDFTPPVGVAFMNVYILFADNKGVRNLTVPFVNKEIELVPPTTGSNKAVINGESYLSTNTNNTIANFKKYLNITNNTSYLLNSHTGNGNLKYGGSGQNGAIFISW